MLSRSSWEALARLGLDQGYAPGPGARLAPAADARTYLAAYGRAENPAEAAVRVRARGQAEQAAERAQQLRRRYRV